MPIQGPQLDWPDDDESAQSSRGVTPFHWLRLALGAARRRKAIAAGVFLAGMAAFTAYFCTRRPVYRVEAKILAQRPQALPSVVRPLFEDAPARSAWELIHRRENLVAIIRQAQLAPAPGGAAHGGNLREWLSRSLSKTKGTTRGAGNPLEGLVVALDKMLVVLVEEGTITIQLDWPDPQQCFAIVQAATQNFLEARHMQEITSIEEVLAVLQSRDEALHQELEAAIQDARQRPARARTTTQSRRSSEDLVRFRATLQAKQRAVQDVEEFRQRRLAELHSQLDQARNTFSEAHPTVIGLRQQVDALSRDSAQLETLRAEEEKARKAYADEAAREGVSLTAAASPRSVTGQLEEDQRVREARLQVEQMDARVSTAEVERDAARAAFKYRYNVIWPPQVPTEPHAPNPLKILGVGLVVSLALALVAGAAPDILSGRVVERWQVERALDVPVLAELRRR
jgi:uncharacterized protein involved in exopolysaccharide biosynthesis